MSAFRTRAVAAVAETMLWRQGNLVIYLVGLVVVSRLLPPEAFGIFAAAAAIFHLAVAGVDFGLSSNLIRSHEQEIRAGELRSALGLAILLAGLATGAMAAVAWIAFAWRGAADFTTTLLILTAALSAAPLVLVAETQLRRALQASLLARIGLATAAINVGATVAAAWAGLGAAALAVGILADQTSKAALLLWARRRAPLVRPRFGGWSAHLAFGSRYTLTTLLPKGAITARTLIVTAALGPAAMGLLNRSQAVTRITDSVLMDGIKPLALPMIAGALRDGIDGARVYLAKIDYLVAVFWPAGVVIAILAEPLVALILGPDWAATVPLVQLLALGAAAHPFTRMSVKIFAALGAEAILLRLQTVQMAVSLALVSAAALMSIEAVCAAIALGLAVKSVRLTRAIKPLVAYDPAALRAILVRGGAIACGAALGPGAMMRLGPPSPVLATVALGIALAGMGWLVSVAATRHPILGEMRLALRTIRPGGAARSS